MSSITAEDIVALFEKDAKARKRLAELLVAEPDVRLAVINAVLRDVATKEDIRELRSELRAEIAEVRGRLWWIVGLILASWTSTILTILFKAGS